MSKPTFGPSRPRLASAGRTGPVSRCAESSAESLALRFLRGTTAGVHHRQACQVREGGRKGGRKGSCPPKSQGDGGEIEQKEKGRVGDVGHNTMVVPTAWVCQERREGVAPEREEGGGGQGSGGGGVTPAWKRSGGGVLPAPAALTASLPCSHTRPACFFFRCCD